MAKPEAGISPPSQEEGAALADWAEAVMVLEERNRLSRASLRGRLSTAGPTDEAAIGLLYAEVRRRGGVAPNSYPFSVDETGIIRRDGMDGRLYELLLFMSLEEASFRERGHWVRVSGILEVIAKAALQSYWGSRCVVVQFGWPSEDGRPKNFPAAVSWLAQRLNLPEGTALRSPNKKDGGVDIVAWIPLDDERPAYCVLLGQVTVGLEALAEKGQGIPVHQWNSWIEFGIPPATAFVIPFAVAVSDELWSDLQYRTSLVLERMRLCSLLTSADVASTLDHSRVKEFMMRERQALVL